MKLSAQLASILPVSPKAGATAVRGTGAFAPAMEELIARFSSEAPVVRPAPEGKLKIPTRAQAAIAHGADLDWLGKNLRRTKLPAIAPDADVPAPHKAEDVTVLAQAGPPEPVLAAKNLELNFPIPPVQGSAVQEANVREASAELPEARRISGKGKPPGPQHMTDTIKPSDAGKIPTAALPDVPVPLLQNPPQHVTVIAPQTEKLAPEPAAPRGGAEPPDGRVSMENKRRPVGTAVLPLPVNSVAPGIVNKQSAQAPQNTSRREESAVPLKETSSATGSQIVLRARPAPSSEAVPSEVMVHQSEGHEVNRPHSDVHPTKESQKETLTVAQGIPAEKASVHAFPAAPVIQQQATANAPVPAVIAHRVQQPMEAHHVEANAAQVLQRMDAASPSSAGQLRADARHLDVGVSSGSLGWVEVRASINPSGKVDAALHLETNASAHVIAAQSKEIVDYAREHSVQLGQISVGVGTGDGSRGSSGSMHEEARSNPTVPLRTTVKDAISSETRESDDKMSLISIRA